MSGQDDLLPPYELALDYFTLAGEKSPGKCEVRGAAREWEWNELSGYGLDGSSLALVRRHLVEFEIDVRLTTQSDLDAWDTFYTKVLQNPASRAGKTKFVTAPASQTVNLPSGQIAIRTPGSRALGIYHPRLARIGITSVVVLRVSQPVQSSSGAETFTIKFKEYRAPKPVFSEVGGNVPAAAKKQPKAKDALDDAIEQETANVKRLQAADDALGSFSSIVGG